MRFCKNFLAVALTFGILAIPIEGFGSDKVRENNRNVLYQNLLASDADAAKTIADEIRLEWSRSGSEAIDYLVKRGKDALERQEFHTSIGHLSAAIDHGPKFAQAHYLRAQAFMSIDKKGHALADLRQTLLLEPRHFDAIGMLGALYMQQNAFEKAEKAFLLLKTIHPHAEGIDEVLNTIKSHTGRRAI
jgi:tetratricopeptide (TPR) repeat protein